MPKLNFKVKGKLNKFQRNNLEILTNDVLKTLRSGDWRSTPSPILKCVSCGGRVSTFNLRYFGYRGEDVLCYKCQEIKSNFDIVPARKEVII